MCKDRIIVNPEIQGGKPIIKGTSITVDYLLELFGKGLSFEQILEKHPELSGEDIIATFQYSFVMSNLCIR
ncbi:MAG: DUF433 domain-containing protein [Thermodesulfovibrionales bacterium]